MQGIDTSTIVSGFQQGKMILSTTLEYWKTFNQWLEIMTLKLNGAMTKPPEELLVRPPPGLQGQTHTHVYHMWNASADPPPAGSSSTKAEDAPAQAPLMAANTQGERRFHTI